MGKTTSRLAACVHAAFVLSLVNGIVVRGADTGTVKPGELIPTPEVFISDLHPVRAANGWNGDPRQDLSIEDNPIRLRGKEYRKGLGVHALSEVVYRARPQYKRFVAVVGVDDEKGDPPAGSITFEVYADDTELFKSDVLTGASQPVAVNVEIPKGAKQIRLVVGDGGDGVASDHGDWAGAGFMTFGEPLPEEPEPVEEGYTDIFNGKDLSGWQNPSGLWRVDKGVLAGALRLGEDVSGSPELKWTGGEPANFILKFKFRVQSGTGHVGYRGGLGGVSLATLSADPSVAGALGSSARGPLADVGQFVIVGEDGAKTATSAVSDPEALTKLEPYSGKSWHKCVIAVRGNHILHQIDDSAIVEVIDNSPHGAGASGPISFLLDGKLPVQVNLKDIWIKPLTATYGKAFLLFDGKGLDGWTHSSDKLKDTWTVESGVLCNAGKPGGYIRTTTDYTSYVFRTQLRHVTSGNGGVLLRMVGPDKVWPRSIESQGMYRNLGDIWNIDQFPMKAAENRTNGRHTRKMHGSNEKPLRQWNQYEITLDGGDLEIKVNDLVQNTAVDCWETPGKICLQSEGAQMQYRNVLLIPIVRDEE